MHVHDRPVTEYYHRAVICHLIGTPLAVPLDVELQRPQEGEVQAGRRLLERVFRSYGRFFEVVVGDALYLEAPFINFCVEHHKHLIVVLKGDHRLLLQDAQGLFAAMTPAVWQTPAGTIRCWDAQGFRSAEGVAVPLRVLHAEETLQRRQRVAGRWQHTQETHPWWWATTLPIARVPDRTLWAIGHARWEIENELFNTLVTHWALNHCYKHDPIAILNFVLTLFIAFVLIQCFHQRNLKPSLGRRLSLIAVSDQVYLGLADPTLRDPWTEPVSGLPP